MERGDSDSLIVLDQFSRMLAEAETLDEVTEIRSRAEAVRSWAKSAAMNLEMQNRAAELKLRAERKAGRLLAELKLRGGNRKSNGHENRLKLSDLGISQNQSKRWQQEAAIPEPEFQEYVRSASKLGEEVTTAGLLRLSRRAGADRTSGSRTEASRGQKNPAPEISQSVARQPNAERQYGDGRAAADLQTESPELTRQIEEIKNHYTVLSNLLEPLCEGRQTALLSGQRRGIRHYLSEIGRLLVQLTPSELDDRQLDRSTT